MYNRMSYSSTGANQADARASRRKMATLREHPRSSRCRRTSHLVSCATTWDSAAASHIPRMRIFTLRAPPAQAYPLPPLARVHPLRQDRLSLCSNTGPPNCLARMSDGICVGLAAEWLLNLPSSPSSRMRALRPGSQSHASAAVRQQWYQDLWILLRSDGAGGSHKRQAISRTMREAGLDPSGETNEI